MDEIKNYPEKLSVLFAFNTNYLICTILIYNVGSLDLNYQYIFHENFEFMCFNFMCILTLNIFSE